MFLIVLLHQMTNPFPTKLYSEVVNTEALGKLHK